MRLITTTCTLIVACAAVAGALFTPSSAVADGMVGMKPKAAKVKPMPVAPAPVAAAPVAPAPVAPVVMEEDCDCGPNFRLSGGLPIAFFDKENNLPMPGIAADFWCDAMPLNFRIGVEGRHMFLGQDSADFARETPDKTTRVSYVRIPLSVEYMHPVDEDTTLFFGGGPDIINTANDVSETSVGMHLSSRVHYAITKEFGLSLEAGYLWAAVDGQGNDHINLNNAFITPMATWTF